MKFYLVGYAHKSGFGRITQGTTEKITDLKIREWEDHIKNDGIESPCVIAISQIDGIEDPATLS